MKKAYSTPALKKAASSACGVPKLASYLQIADFSGCAPNLAPHTIPDCDLEGPIRSDARAIVRWSILHGGLNSIQIATSRLEPTPDSARVVRPTRRGSSCWDLQGADDEQIVARANVAMPGSGR
jgi:hypothetical protein